MKLRTEEKLNEHVAIHDERRGRTKNQRKINLRNDEMKTIRCDNDVVDLTTVVALSNDKEMNQL